MTTIRLFAGWLSVLILAVSVVPLVPSRLAPDLGALGLTLVLVTSDDRAVVRWVVWVGFGLELLSPAHFGLGWLGLLLSGLLGLELRRQFSVSAAPWVWPGWFAGLTLVAVSPVVLSVHAWPAVGPVVLATTGWGTLLALLVQWFRASHPVAVRSLSGSDRYGHAL